MRSNRTITYRNQTDQRAIATQFNRLIERASANCENHPWTDLPRNLHIPTVHFTLGERQLGSKPEVNEELFLKYRPPSRT
jgi:hypothetical protein